MNMIRGSSPLDSAYPTNWYIADCIVCSSLLEQSMTYNLSLIIKSLLNKSHVYKQGSSKNANENNAECLVLYG